MHLQRIIGYHNIISVPYWIYNNGVWLETKLHCTFHPEGFLCTCTLPVKNTTWSKFLLSPRRKWATLGNWNFDRTTAKISHLFGNGDEKWNAVTHFLKISFVIHNGLTSSITVSECVGGKKWTSITKLRDKKFTTHNLLTRKPVALECIILQVKNITHCGDILGVSFLFSVLLGITLLRWYARKGKKTMDNHTATLMTQHLLYKTWARNHSLMALVCRKLFPHRWRKTGVQYMSCTSTQGAENALKRNERKPGSTCSDPALMQNGNASQVHKYAISILSLWKMSCS